MKARIKPADRLTRKEKEIIDAYLIAEREHVMRRFFKLACLSLNTKHGFGLKRGLDFMDEIGTLAAEHEHDEVFWYHVDRELEKIGYDFDSENYEEVDR